MTIDIILMHTCISTECMSPFSMIVGGKKTQWVFIELRLAIVQICVWAFFDWIALTCTNCPTKTAKCLCILPMTMYLGKMVLLDDFAIQKVRRINL